MSFFVFPMQAIIIYLNLLPFHTAIDFPEDIIEYGGGDGSIVHVQDFKTSRRTLLLSLRKRKGSTLTVITKSGTSYTLDLRFNKSKSFQKISIYPGVESAFGEEVFQGATYSVLKGDRSVCVKKKGNKRVVVNGRQIDDRICTHKGPPLEVNGKEFNLGI